jgi:glycerol-3-phosphate dehydrogenase subunit C
VFPKYETGTFSRWAKKNSSGQKSFENRVIYFHGCYVNYNNHALGKDFFSVLNAMNIGVVIPEEKCCGVPLIANGYIEKAKKNARYNIKSLEDSSGSGGMKIVSTSSSCTFALRHEYPGLLGLDNSAISGRIEYASAFLHAQFESGNIPKMKNINVRAAYHSPCHLQRLGGVIYTIDLLKRIPGLELVILNSECCGIAGTYGFKKEYYDISQKIGSGLFKLIEAAEPEIVITDCETCKMQIEMNTPYEVVHPVSLLARAIAHKVTS